LIQIKEARPFTRSNRRRTNDVFLRKFTLDGQLVFVNKHCHESSNSHFTERGCVRSISRSAWIRRAAWYRAVVLRLVGTTQPRSGLK
jgi:hypothetical protein